MSSLNEQFPYPLNVLIQSPGPRMDRWSRDIQKAILTAPRSSLGSWREMILP